MLKNVSHLGPDQLSLIGISDGKQLQTNTNTLASDVCEVKEQVLHLPEETLGVVQCSKGMLLVLDMLNHDLLPDLPLHVWLKFQIIKHQLILLGFDVILRWTLQ